MLNKNVYNFILYELGGDYLYDNNDEYDILTIVKPA